jgi:excisionase family DNA binding protein
MIVDSPNDELSSPKPAEMELAKATSRKLAALMKEGADLRLQTPGSPSDELVVPMHAAKMLLDILVQISRGNAVQLSSLEPEISTQEAADILCVSRPYVVKLTEEGELACRKVGPRRLLRLDDVMAYKKSSYAKRTEAMTELVRFSEEMGLYDFESKK